MKPLHLTLKKKWFDMIASGEKPEEYREIKEYWHNRLVDEIHITDGSFRCINGLPVCSTIKYKPFSTVIFKNGYAKDAPTMEFELKEITIGRGNPEWGAFPDKDVFIIKLGGRI